MADAYLKEIAYTDRAANSKMNSQHANGELPLNCSWTEKQQSIVFSLGSLKPWLISYWHLVEHNVLTNFNSPV